MKTALGFLCIFASVLAYADDSKSARIRSFDDQKVCFGYAAHCAPDKASAIRMFSEKMEARALDSALYDCQHTGHERAAYVRFSISSIKQSSGDERIGDLWISSSFQYGCTGHYQAPSEVIASGSASLHSRTGPVPETAENRENLSRMALSHAVQSAADTCITSSASPIPGSLKWEMVASYSPPVDGDSRSCGGRFVCPDSPQSWTFMVYVIGRFQCLSP